MHKWYLDVKFALKKKITTDSVTNQIHRLRVYRSEGYILDL